VQVAVERLGFGICMHISLVLPYANRVQLMLDAVREQDMAKRHNIVRGRMNGHASVADLPFFFFFFAAKLIVIYPETAMVLRQRSNGAI
jgi:hypothetical protein